MIDQPRDDAGLIADLVQMPMAVADRRRRDLPDQRQHRRIHAIGGEQRGAGIEQARARHDGVGLRFGGITVPAPPLQRTQPHSLYALTAKLPTTVMVIIGSSPTVRTPQPKR